MSDRILIVEDERITAEDLTEILEGMGYEVTATVSSGEEAIVQAEQNPPDLALMDIRIRGSIDGIETATILRGRYDIPVIYLTAYADPETLDRAKRSMPMGYVMKPLQESELQASIEIALYRHRSDLRLKRRETFADRAVGAMQVACICTDLNGTVVIFNRAASQITGWGQGDALRSQARHVLRLVDLPTGLEVDLPLHQVARSNMPAGIGDKVLISKSGERVQIAGTIAPVLTSLGTAAGAVILFEPVSHAEEFASLPQKSSKVATTLEFSRYHMIAVSDQMRQTIAFAERVARSEASVILLEGESGTGKDLIAQFLHHCGSRSSRPFVAINCLAIPETLLESELFGHEPGAFSDARTQKKGLFEIANGGTLFLDEIGDVSPAVQSKLLRVLETRSFRRLGGVRDIEVDVRVISATNRGLAQAVDADQFRLDLFHRLSIIQIVVPPLRERREDILPLAMHFVWEFAHKYQTRVKGISPAAGRLLEAHEWSGNVRELRNVIERAVLIEESVMIQPANVKFVSIGRNAHPGAPADLSLKNSQRQLIIEAIAKTAGNKTRAAALLGISRDVLRYRMRQLRIEEHRKDTLWPRKI